MRKRGSPRIGACGWTKIATPRAAAASHTGARAASSRSSPATLAPISTAGKRSTDTTRSSSFTARSGACSGSPPAPSSRARVTAHQLRDGVVLHPAPLGRRRPGRPVAEGRRRGGEELTADAGAVHVLDAPGRVERVRGEVAIERAAEVEPAAGGRIALEAGPAVAAVAGREVGPLAREDVGVDVDRWRHGPPVVPQCILPGAHGPSPDPRDGDRPPAGAGLWPAPAHAQSARPTGLTFMNDVAYQSIPLAAPPLLGQVPKAVDLSSRFPEPGDQGKQNSCVGWAVAYALKSYQEGLERSWGTAPTPASVQPRVHLQPAQQDAGLPGWHHLLRGAEPAAPRRGRDARRLSLSRRRLLAPARRGGANGGAALRDRGLAAGERAGSDGGQDAPRLRLPGPDRDDGRHRVHAVAGRRGVRAGLRQDRGRATP